MSMIEFDAVNIVFGNRPERALPLMDAGLARAEIQERTGQTLGVHDARLSVGAGEIVVLMGLSGSGKSTLLRAVNGLNPVLRGAVRVADGDGMCDIARAGARRIRALRRTHVTMVFQNFGLLPWRSVAQNAGFGLELRGGAGQAERVREALALVGLEGWEDRPIRELSGGMQQRVGLARALATAAPILLMDEPFSALDPLIRTKLQDDLLDMQARTGRTILFVSHDLDEAIRIGSRIAIMEGGRIVQVGTPEEILLSPATPYVAEFVAHISPLPVLRVQNCMSQTPPPANAPQIAVNMRIEQLRPALCESDNQIWAVVDAGEIIGSLRRGDILRRLLAR